MFHWKLQSLSNRECDGSIAMPGARRGCAFLQMKLVVGGCMWIEYWLWKEPGYLGNYLVSSLPSSVSHYEGFLWERTCISAMRFLNLHWSLFLFWSLFLIWWWNFSLNWRMAVSDTSFSFWKTFLTCELWSLVKLKTFLKVEYPNHDNL